MTALSVVLLIAAILFFIFTRETYVYLIYEKEFRIEFHPVLFSLVLTQKTEQNENKGPGFKFYFALSKRLSKLSEKSCIRINSFKFAKVSQILSSSNVISPYIYHATISSFLVYLNQRAKNLVLDDNAFIPDPDNITTNKIDIRISTELYNLLPRLTEIILDFRKYKRNES